MDDLQRDILRQHRVKIVNDLEPRGKVLDTLYEDGVLTENDLELVSSAKTRKERCHVLLSILPTRGPSAYGSFQKALGDGNYDFLATELNAWNDVELSGHDTSGKRIYGGYGFCEQCDAFLVKTVKHSETLNICLCRIVTNHCCLLLDNIEPRDLVDQLFQDRVIAADDIEKIAAQNTRRDRCEIMFKMLLAKQNHLVVESLKVSLMKKYSYIVENISNAVDEKRLQRKTSERHKKDTKTQDSACDEPAQLCTKAVESSGKDNDAIFIFTDNSRKARVLRKKKFSPGGSTEPNERERQTLGTENIQKDNTCPKTREDSNATNEAVGGMDFVDGAYVCEPIKQRLSKVHTANTVGVYNYNVKGTVSARNESQNISHAEVEKGESDQTARNGKSLTLKRIQKKHKVVERDSMINDQHPVTKIDDENNDLAATGCSTQIAVVPKQVTAIQSEKPKKRLMFAFNYLSTLINEGDFIKFGEISMKLRIRFPGNYDLLCIIGYLQTSRDLFQTDFDSAKKHIDSTMALVPKTSNPRYFALEIFTTKTRMYITQKKLEKLQTTLDEAMMILETDPVGCTGRAAGWLYINDARNKTARLSCLNLSHPNALKVYERLFDNARTSFQRSMTNFKRDGGKDGPFGFGYALCRLVILLLRCGDNGLTMSSLTPIADEIKTAGQYLQHLEDSDIVITKILDMHFRLAKCDYQFRRGNCIRALEHAQIAHALATEMRLFEFTEHAYNRVSFLTPKVSACFATDKVSDEEAERILFEDSTDTDLYSQNE